MPVRHTSWTGHKGERIFSINPAFKRVTFKVDVALAQRKFFARSDTNLLLHQIDSGNEFGHGVLDLNPGIHLNKIKLIVFV